ncbi:MAG: hypothetical protein OEL69_09450 [Nitrosopumilus sp.]|nr:hypothetical protein [Nitrosopumilus sp.]
MPASIAESIVIPTSISGKFSSIIIKGNSPIATAMPKIIAFHAE